MLETILEKCRANKLLVCIAAAGLVLGVSFIFFNRPARTERVQSVTKLASSMTEMASSVKGAKRSNKELSDQTDPSPSKTIMVDVKGAVTKPGLYKLPASSRVNDAIRAAGGMTAQAEPKSVNLAQKLADEAVVYVAAAGEAISVIPESSTDTAGSSGAAAQAGQSHTGKINLNTATAEELQTISGIGEKRSQDIIAYREAKGSFKSVDDLRNVSGIGDKTLENLRAYVTVD